MPPALTNLYTTPNDVFDYLGVEGVDLRLDDHNLATGQKIQATADAAQGATAISIAALACPLLAGSVLQFDGSGMPAQVQVQLTSFALKGAQSLTVAPLPAQVNNLAAATDDGVNVATAARLMQACREGTIKVQEYCMNRYDDSQLVLSNIVSRWARTLAVRWLMRRRAQGASKGIEADAEDVMEEMKGVRAGFVTIADCGTRTSPWPYMSNVLVDVRYEFARVRVEPALSEGTPTLYGQYVDWSSIYYLGYY